MKQLIAIIVLLAFAAPVRAQLPSGFEPVEKNLIEKQKLEDSMTRDMQKGEPQKKAEGKSSSWWKWVLGIAIVGGVAAAASGGGGGGGGNNNGNSNGTIRVGW